MIITLNLLDTNRKKHYLRKRVFSTIGKSVEIFLFFVLIIGVALSVAEYALEENFQVVTEQTTFINKNVTGFNKDIDKANKKLEKIDKVQKEYIAWSPLLMEIANAVPSGVRVESLIIDKKESSLKIKGQANTRDNFLITKSNLEKIFFISKVESPITNLLAKENVSFDLTITLDFSRL